jgi:hypothetical protein
MKTEAMLCGKSAPRMSLDGADAMELGEVAGLWRKEASYWRKSDHSCLNGRANGVTG